MNSYNILIYKVVYISTAGKYTWLNPPTTPDKFNHPHCHWNPSLQTNYNELCFHKKCLHTFRDWLRHGYSCVFSLLLQDWGLVVLIPFISPLSVIQSSPGTQLTHTLKWARSTGDTNNTLKEFKGNSEQEGETRGWGGGERGLTHLWWDWWTD